MTEPSPLSPATTPAAGGAPVWRWALHRRLYNWVLSFSHHRHSTLALFALSFAESSFFPIPPDVLLGPLCLGNRRKSMWFAAVTTVASVLGALLGYAIGHFAWGATAPFWYRYIPGFTPELFERVHGLYNQYGVLVLFAAAFSPIPFKVFTIAGGVFAQPLLPFVLVSLVGRALRFFLVAAIFHWVGPRALPFIDRYFNLLCIVFTLLLVGGVVAIKMLN